MNIKFKKLNNSIIKCKKCSRLIKFSKKISIIKRKQNITEVYWGKPVTGFGDIDAKLMIIGLAPAAMVGQELEEHLQVINLVIFYLAVSIRLVYPTSQPLHTVKMA